MYCMLDSLSNGVMELPVPKVWQGRPKGFAAKEVSARPGPASKHRDADFLRLCAWEIGEKRPTDTYVPSGNHAGLGMVSPYRGFAHWRILPDWIDRTARQRGDAWHDCRLVLRLYDV